MNRLAGESWSLWRRETMNPLLYEHVASFFRKAGFFPDVRYESGEAEAVYLWAASGIAISLVPADTVSAVSQPGVVIRPLIDPTPSWDHVLIWRRDDQSPAVRRLLELEVKLLETG
jgi:DNA-binding transcriptional LysR family regulator